METSKKILEVCDKYNLKIWAEGGTLLGAVRHQGFIPWDDDMDFVMMRDDYEKFKIIGPREFQYPYFFQSFNTDNWAGGLVRVCRSDTTMIDERFKKLKPHNYGIFVDVIVMDGIPHSEQVYAKECKKVERMMRLLSRYCEFKPDFSNIRATLRSVIVKAIFMFINPQKYHERIVQLLSSYDIGSHPTCGKIQLGSRFNFGPKKIKRRNCSWYSDTEWLSFHDMKLPAPKEWNNVLTSQFGKEYMTPQKSPSWHKVSIIDTKRSYVDILSEIEGKA